LSDLKTVLKTIIDAHAKWYYIGLQLEIPAGDLDGLAANNMVARDCLRETLAFWLRRVQPLPTWERLANALKNRTVGEWKLAKKIEDRALQQVGRKSEAETSCY